MSNEHKTRAERIEDAARAVTESLYPSDEQAIHVGSLAAALALPPDPPRGDGWEALRELQSQSIHESAQEIRSRIDIMLAAAPKEPEPAESPAEPAQDDEAAISQWEDITRLHQARVTSGVFVSPSTLASGVSIMRRLAREKDDLRAKLAASDEILAEVRVEADGLMRALRRIAKLGKGGA